MTRHIERLRHRRQFLRVANERRKWFSPSFILQAAERSPLGSPTLGAGSVVTGEVTEGRDPGECFCPEVSGTQEPGVPGAQKVGHVGVGFTISKKVGNAVQRNRVRRRLKEAVRQILPRKAQENTDYVLIGRTEALTRPFPEILNDLRISLERIERIEPGTSSPPPPAKGWRKKKKKRRKSTGKKP